KKHGEM
ncbi:hypothetical protein TGP89_230110B, partial [Toxoplasma gondii p89]